MMVPEWLRWARREIGIREIVGPRHAARVLEYWSLGKVPLGVNDDETPWCAAFVCAALESNGTRSARTARARGSEAGKHFARCDARAGAIIVLSSDRGTASGHVGFLEGVSPGKLHILGGNQNNQVSVAPFPASRLVAMLWPTAAPCHQPYPMAPTLAASRATVSDR